LNESEKEVAKAISEKMRDAYTEQVKNNFISSMGISIRRCGGMGM